MDAERDHLQELQKRLRRAIHELELQRADYGVAVPLEIVSGLAEKQAELRAVEAALASPVSTGVMAALGPEGQAQLLYQELRFLRQARAQHDADDQRDRATRQHTLDERDATRMRLLRWIVVGISAIGVLLLIGLGVLFVLIQIALALLRT